MSHLCYLGLGSNLKFPERQLRKAIKAIHALPKTQFITSSSFYKNPPLGNRFQPKYCNLVVAIRTNLSPDSLLMYCQKIEAKQGRVRKSKWGSRTLDIDILRYGNKILNKPHLIIPHPQMQYREFVIRPLLEIEP